MNKKIHILLVDHSDADIELTRDMLTSTKFDIDLSVAKDGVEAIDFLTRDLNWASGGCPALILLDLNLPRKDGRQVLAIIKGHDELRRIPVVVLSSSDSDKDITSCYNLGANCYIVKPVELQAFRDILRKLEGFWLGAAALPRREGHSAATGIGFRH